MITFRAISAGIRIGARDLPHYEPEFDDANNTVTCWIPSEAGKEYRIWVERDKPTEYGVTALIYLDGSSEYVSRLTLRPTVLQGARSALYLSENTKRPFTFARLQRTDDESILSNTTSPTSPGTIRIALYRVRVAPCDGPLAGPDRPFKHDPVVREMTRESGEHVTLLGPVRTVPERVRGEGFRTAGPHEPSDEKPFVTFVFRYRPAGVLQATGIIPREQPQSRFPLRVRSPQPRSPPRARSPQPRSPPRVLSPQPPLPQSRPPSSPRSMYSWVGRGIKSDDSGYESDDGDKALEAELLAIQAQQTALAAQQAVLEARRAALTAERAAAKAQRAARLLSMTKKKP